MKKVFILESCAISRSFWRASLEQYGGWDFYILESLEDFDFRVKDFAPELLVINAQLVNKEYADFVERCNGLVSDIPIVFVVDEKTEACSFKQLERPLEVGRISDQLMSFLD